MIRRIHPGGDGPARELVGGKEQGCSRVPGHGGSVGLAILGAEQQPGTLERRRSMQEDPLGTHHEGSGFGHHGASLAPARTLGARIRERHQQATPRLHRARG